MTMSSLCSISRIRQSLGFQFGDQPLHFRGRSVHAGVGSSSSNKRGLSASARAINRHGGDWRMKGYSRLIDAWQSRSPNRAGSPSPLQTQPLLSALTQRVATSQSIQQRPDQWCGRLDGT